jgi:regulator of sigma E protease
LSAIVASLYITGALFVATVVGVVQLIIHIPSLLLGLFSNSVPQAAEAASGPVGIVFILKSISSLGISYVVLFMANIAVALAAFNVLPLPALDGGRFALISIQKLLKKRLQAETEAKIHAIGFMVLIGLIVLISVYDLRKFL